MLKQLIPTLGLFFLISQLQAHAFDSKHSIAFKLAGGLPVVQATVNGIQGNFVIDLGAAEVILNEKYFKEAYPSMRSTSGIHVNKVETAELKIKELIISTLHVENIFAQVIDLQHLEQSKNQPIHGLLGFELWKNYEVALDYVREKMTLYERNKSTAPRRFTTTGTPPTVSLDFTFIGHLACVTAYVGTHRLRLALDSGAEINIVDHRWKKKLRPHFQKRGQFLVRGISSQERQVEYIKLKQLWIGDRSYPFMRSVLSDLRPISSSIDGILGYEFFVRCQKVAIDFKKRRFHIWHLPDQSTSPPEKSTLVRTSDTKP